MTDRVLTVDELADRCGVTLEWMAKILADFEARAVVERVGDDGWRLTERGYHAFGQPLLAGAPDRSAPARSEEREAA